MVTNSAARGFRVSRRQMQPRGIKVKNEGLGRGRPQPRKGFRQPVVPKIPAGYFTSLRDFGLRFQRSEPIPADSIALPDFRRRIFYAGIFSLCQEVH